MLRASVAGSGKCKLQIPEKNIKPNSQSDSIDINKGIKKHRY